MAEQCSCAPLVGQTLPSTCDHLPDLFPQFQFTQIRRLKEVKSNVDLVVADQDKVLDCALARAHLTNAAPKYKKLDIKRI